MLTDMRGFVLDDKQQQWIETLEAVFGAGIVTERLLCTCYMCFGSNREGVLVTLCEQPRFGACEIWPLQQSPITKPIKLKSSATPDDLLVALKLCGHKVEAAQPSQLTEKAVSE